MEALYTREAWLGGFYELALEYSTGSPQSLDEGLKAIWSRPGVEGCYLHADIELDSQQRLAPALTTLESGVHLLGTAMLPFGKRVPCGVCMVRGQLQSDWITFYI